MTTFIYTSKVSPIEARFTKFLSRAYDTHSTQYDYSNVNYINTSSDIEIICPIHGSFWQSATAHITQKQGCPHCGGIKRAETRTKTTEQFIEESNIIHNEKYNYISTIYKNDKENVSIRCTEHGDFPQTPNNHLSGKGCPKCAHELKRWKTRKHSPRANDYCVVYDIKLTGNGETFYKTGISNKYLDRHNDITRESGYEIEVLNIIIDTRYNCEVLADKVQANRQRRFNYIPKVKFGGYTECYLIS